MYIFSYRELESDSSPLTRHSFQSWISQGL